jgi:hypothetical protein
MAGIIKLPHKKSIFWDVINEFKTEQFEIKGVEEK